MIDFDKRILERADEDYANTHRIAAWENAAYDEASKLEVSLKDYLQRNAPDIALSRSFDLITLSQGGTRVLTILSKDHKRYDVRRPGSGDVRDDMRVRFGGHLTERQMMDEVLEWLAVNEGA